MFVFARTFAYRQAYTCDGKFISAYIYLCENMQVYVRAVIVYWLDLTFNCVLFDSVLFLACL